MKITLEVEIGSKCFEGYCKYLMHRECYCTLFQKDLNKYDTERCQECKDAIKLSRLNKKYMINASNLIDNL